MTCLKQGNSYTIVCFDENFTVIFQKIYTIVNILSYVTFGACFQNLFTLKQL